MSLNNYFCQNKKVVLHTTEYGSTRPFLEDLWFTKSSVIRGLSILFYLITYTRVCPAQLQRSICSAFGKVGGVGKRNFMDHLGWEYVLSSSFKIRGKHQA